MIEAGSTTLLVDPLLAEDFGHTLRNRFMVYPPRRVDVGRMPALHGVLITHEHEDHFDPPGLARLPRTVPMYLSARASVAAPPRSRPAREPGSSAAPIHVFRSSRQPSIVPRVFR